MLKSYAENDLILIYTKLRPKAANKFETKRICYFPNQSIISWYVKFIVMVA